MQFSRRNFTLAAILVLTQSGALAQTQEDIDRYPRFAKAVSQWGYDWEPHTVRTEDGWYLTLFRVTGREGRRPALLEANRHRAPVLAQHGGFDSGQQWSGDGLIFPTLHLALVDRGFDVWVGNSRGTEYSNVNDRDGEWSLKERWDFSWAEMGTYDLPAVAEYMIEVTGKPKISIMGYSQGNAQAFYALAKYQDYWEDKMERLVAIGACVYDILDGTYEGAVQWGATMRELGHYVYFGGDEASWVYEVDCLEYGLCLPFESGGDALTLGSTEYWEQLWVAGRFQEPQTFEKWAAGEIYTEEIKLSNIDRTPVSFVVSIDDADCPPQMAEWNYMEVQSEKHFRLEHGDHVIYSWKTNRAFIDRMESTLDTGRVEDSAQELVQSLTITFATLLAFATSAI